jgi:hypothetical protein
MKHRVLVFSFVWELLNTTLSIFGMESPRTVTTFYAKDQDNKYYLFDKKGLHTDYNQYDFPYRALAPHNSHTNLHYNPDNHAYSLINNGKILSSGTLTKPLINTLRTNIKHRALYAQLDNKHCAHIKHILTTTNAESLDLIIEQLKKDNNIDIIEGGDFNQHPAIGPSHKTILKTVLMLLLIYIVQQYAHRLPKLFNTFCIF